VALSQGRVEMPPIMHLHVGAQKDVDVKAAHVRGQETITVKIGAAFFSNRELGVPSSPSLMVVLSAVDGSCRAVLLENGYLTDLRTGLAGALAARHLAPTKPLRVGIVGTGAAARSQLLALRLVREIFAVQVWGRDARAAASYSAEMSAALDVGVTPSDSL